MRLAFHPNRAKTLEICRDTGMPGYESGRLFTNIAEIRTAGLGLGSECLVNASLPRSPSRLDAPSGPYRDQRDATRNRGNAGDR